MRSLVSSCAIIVCLLVGDVLSEKVDIPDLGEVLGTETRSAWTIRTIYSFYGIRFAKSPSGPRRFMPPERVDPWEGEYNATVPGRVCPQLYNTKYSYSSSEDHEDCLLLNVFTPVLPKISNKSVRLPVMVYLHGGGFYENSARSFPPNYLLEEDVILVVPQYRLGPLGFLSLHTEGISGNVGMMDMVAALEWVQRHIDAFGGDNSQVTVFGQSAGSASILLMLMSPMVNETLFQRAILQSGSGTSSWITDDDQLSFAMTYYEELTNNNKPTDIKSMENHFKNATVEELHTALLRVLATNPLAKASKLVVQTSGKVRFMEYHPVDLFRIGSVRSVPMMTGVTRHDGSFIVTTLYRVLKINNLLQNSYYLRNNLTRDIVQLFDIPDDNWVLTDLLETKYFWEIFNSKQNITFDDVLPALIDISGLLFFKSAVFRQAKVNAINSPTYLYTFDYAGEYTRFGYGEDTSEYPFDGGVHHSNDLLYLFPYHYDHLNKEDTRMARIMVDLWTSFAINGRPSSPYTDDWVPFTKGASGPFFHINETCYNDSDFLISEYKTYD